MPIVCGLQRTKACQRDARAGKRLSAAVAIISARTALSMTEKGRAPSREKGPNGVPVEDHEKSIRIVSPSPAGVCHSMEDENPNQETTVNAIRSNPNPDDDTAYVKRTTWVGVTPHPATRSAAVQARTATLESHSCICPWHTQLDRHMEALTGRTATTAEASSTMEAHGWDPRARPAAHENRSEAPRASRHNSDSSRTTNGKTFCPESRGGARRACIAAPACLSNDAHHSSPDVPGADSQGDSASVYGSCSSRCLRASAIAGQSSIPIVRTHTSPCNRAGTIGE